MKMRQFSYGKNGKIVRDKVPDSLAKDGASFIGRNLSVEESKKELLNKLLEEAYEAFHSPTKENLLEELADVREVVYAILRVNGMTIDQLEEARLKKLNSRGSFDNSLFIESINVPDKPSYLLDYVLSKKEEYPEKL